MKAEVNTTLTNAEAMAYLLTGSTKDNFGMIGKIRSKGKCPKCGEDFVGIQQLGFLCHKCKTIPTRFYLDFFWKGKRIRIFSDKQGQVLDSFKRSQNLLEHINYEIQNHIFDPSRYIKSDLERFYFENLINRWLTDKIREAEKGHLAWSYIKPLKGYVKNYLVPFFMGKDVRDLRATDIKDFFRRLPDRLSPKMVKNILNALENFFNVLLSDEVLIRKPSFPRIEVPEPSTNWCTREIQEKLLNEIPNEDLPIFYFLARQGLREGEAVVLKWKDIDLENGIVTPVRTMSDRKIVERTKSKKIRPRLLHPDILNLLKSMPQGLPEAYLFINPRTGNPYQTYVLQRIWKKVCRKVGVAISLYQATRHSVASMAATNGVDINIIKAVLGHTDIRTTQRYAHLDVLAQGKVFDAQNKLTVTRLSLEEFRKP